jgi:hypothetical protein
MGRDAPEICYHALCARGMGLALPRGFVKSAGKI